MSTCKSCGGSSNGCCEKTIITKEGKRGLQGDPGPAGSVGPQGPAGSQGIPGQDGAQGIQGDQGIQGIQGDPGVGGISNGVTALPGQIFVDPAPLVDGIGTGFGVAVVNESWSREIVMGTMIHIETYVDITTGGVIVGADNQFKVLLPSGVLTNDVDPTKSSHYVTGRINDPLGGPIDGTPTVAKRRDGESSIITAWARGIALAPNTRYIFRSSGIIYNG